MKLEGVQIPLWERRHERSQKRFKRWDQMPILEGDWAWGGLIKPEGGTFNRAKNCFLWQINWRRMN